MIKFTVGGRAVSARNLGEELRKAMVDQAKAHIRQQVAAICDPETGAFADAVVLGDSLETLKVEVRGSPGLIALVKERLGVAVSQSPQALDQTMPRVFLSYAFEDQPLAKQIAQRLMANGIDTWWAEWCIATGDSLRQKIDDGIGSCTHFLVLLTPVSITKAWVNQEIDAGFVRKLGAQCRFLPVRHGLAASSLPPLLSGMHAPEMKGDDDIDQLVRDIFGVSRKPALGPVPAAVAAAADVQTGYSPAATAIAKYLVEHSNHGMFDDPSIEVDELAAKLGLSAGDIKDGLYELSGYLKISRGSYMVRESLFGRFDQYWKGWNPEIDAVRLATDIAGDPRFTDKPREICDLYGWSPRQLNAACGFMLARDMLVDHHFMGTAPFALGKIVGKEDPIRRFLKGRG